MTNNHFDEQFYFNAESERLLMLYRTFLVVEVLQKNSKNTLMLDISKICFFEFAISDHNLTRRVITHFKPDTKLDDRFYVKNIYETFVYPGKVFEDSIIRKNIAILCNKGLLKLSPQADSIFLETSASLVAPQNSLVVLWRDSLIKLKPFVAKSITQLYRGLLESPNA
jgi:hypothetical protein